MLYNWDKPDLLSKLKTLKKSTKLNSFTLLLPAYKEEQVLPQTIASLAKINYPKALTQILVLLRKEDQSTIDIAQDTILKLNQNNIKILVVDDTTQNKPNQLNWGLKVAQGDIITIFDAEDEASPEILNVVNNLFNEKNLDILQNSVQLIDYKSKWFSLLNCLEYFFWFKSTLKFFAENQVMPLGGNSVFIRRELLEKQNWDESCLTEDAELGIRLAKFNPRIYTVNRPDLTTKEETPPNTSEFIRQRSRWIQGFIQVLFKPNWLELGSLKKIFLAIYILFWPILQTFSTIYFISLLFYLSFNTIPIYITLSLVSSIFLLVIQLSFLCYGYYMMCKEYKLKYSILHNFNIIFGFIPYQALIIYSGFRAIYRHFTVQTNWEKTKHSNLHRNNLNPIEV